MRRAADTETSELDLTVRLGGDPSAVPGLEPFFRFRFSEAASGAASPNEFRIFVDPLDESAREEIWHTAGPIRVADEAGIAWVESPAHLFAHVELELAREPGLDRLSQEAYRRLLALATRRGYPNLLRAWSFVPGINDGTGDRERYKQFSLGRALALEEAGYGPNQLPAGTAIGTGPSTPLTLSLLATRLDCRPVENPRQVSAYAYPRCYGPRGPSFSRAVITGSSTAERLFVSGTASIVGCESCHLDDPRGQVVETMRNIRALTACWTELRGGESGARSEPENLRVYVRRVGDLDAVREQLASLVTPDCRTLFVRGDICRRELLVEIEGVFGR